MAQPEKIVIATTDVPLNDFSGGGDTTNLVPSELLHNDGSLWARGQTLDGEMQGYGEWFRKDAAAVMRSARFERGIEDVPKLAEWVDQSTYNILYREKNAQN